MEECCNHLSQHLIAFSKSAYSCCGLIMKDVSRSVDMPRNLQRVLAGTRHVLSEE